LYLKELELALNESTCLLEEQKHNHNMMKERVGELEDG